MRVFSQDNTAVIHVLFLILAATFYGFITVGGQYFSARGFSLYEIACLILFACPLYVPLLFLRPKYRIRRAHLWFYVVFGLIGAGLQITQFAGIVLGVPVAVVALLLYSQPVWTTLLGRVLLREAITVRKISAVVLALVGIVGLLNPFSESSTFPASGLFFALLAGLFLSLWVIWGRKSALRRQHFLTTSFGYAFFSSVWLIVLLPVLKLVAGGTAFLRFDISVYRHEWLAVAGFAVFASFLPAVLAFAGMRRVDASVAGLLLLFEPLSAAFMAKLFFQQPLTGNIWFGAAFILLGNAVLVGGKNSRRPAEATRS